VRHLVTLRSLLKLGFCDVPPQARTTVNGHTILLALLAGNPVPGAPAGKAEQQTTYEETRSNR